MRARNFGTSTDLPFSITSAGLSVRGGFGIRSTGSGAFDLDFANTENLTAARTLTIKVNDAARTIDLSGNLTLAGAASLPAIVAGDLWYGSATGIISALAKDTGTSRFLKGGNAPSWVRPAFTDLSDAISVAQMGSTSYAVSAIAFMATGVNFNSANTDTAIPITLPAGFTRYRVNLFMIGHASASITTATCAAFTAAGAGGTTLVTNPTAITVSTASEGTNNNLQQLNIVNGPTTSFRLVDVPTLYFRVITPQGSVATADVTVWIIPLP
jgi:hypothetical protein